MNTRVLRRRYSLIIERSCVAIEISAIKNLPKIEHASGFKCSLAVLIRIMLPEFIAVNKSILLRGLVNIRALRAPPINGRQSGSAYYHTSKRKIRFQRNLSPSHQAYANGVGRLPGSSQTPEAYDLSPPEQP